MIETTGLADPGPVAQTFFMDDEIAESYLLDSILTLVDAKHGDQQLDARQEARRQVGFADQIFISKTDLVDGETVEGLIHRIKHMNPRARQTGVNFGDVPISQVFDLKGFNLNAKLEIDPEFLKADDHDHDTTATTTTSQPRPRARRALRPPAPPCPRRRREIVRVSRRQAARRRQARGLPRRDRPGLRPKLLRYKGVLYMKGADRKVIFQGVHQLMGSDLGPKWMPGEKRRARWCSSVSTCRVRSWSRV